MLTKAITGLINQSDRFYADFIQQMDRVASERIPTAGVRFNNARIELMYNPTWWAKLDLPMQMAVLKHECMHIICEHIERVKVYGADPVTHKFYNVCMDFAVNSLIDFPNEVTIDGTKMSFITIDNYKKEYPTLKGGQPFDYYVAYFREEEQKGKEMSEALKNAQFDGHEGMYEKDGTPSEVQKQIVRHAVNQAAEAGRRAGTNPPEGVRQLIKKMFVDNGSWKRELRQFTENAEVCDIEPTRKVRNRRYGIVYPGDRKVRRKRIGLGFDVSGSITNEVAALLVAECDKIIAAGCELVVMFFGTEVVKVDTWTKTPDLSTYHIPDGGGTLFQPVYDKVKELSIDGLIMLTDGYNFDQVVTKPACPVLFGIIGNAGYKSDFGKVIHITEDDK